MSLKRKLKLYNGILFGRTGNSIEARFKLIGTIAKDGVEELYRGYRCDNVNSTDFYDSYIVRDHRNPDKVMFVSPEQKFDFRRTIFRHESDDDFYYDVLDGNTPCILIDRSVDKVEKGCLNVEKLNHYSSIANAKVKTKRDNRRKWK